MHRTLIHTLLTSMVVTTTPALSHHSASAIFDMTRPIEMTATLTGVRWINPHIRLSLDPIDKDEFAEPWVFESQPPQWYRRVGVSRATFEDAIGQTVSVVGRPAHNGEPFGFLLRITFEDGTAFQMVVDRGENQE